MGFHEVPECSITFRMLLSPSIGFYAMFSEFGPSLSYLILSYLIFLIFCLPAGFWCWDDFKYPRGYPHVRQCQPVRIESGQLSWQLLAAEPCLIWWGFPIMLSNLQYWDLWWKDQWDCDNAWSGVRLVLHHIHAIFLLSTCQVLVTSGCRLARTMKTSMVSIGVVGWKEKMTMRVGVCP